MSKQTDNSYVTVSGLTKRFGDLVAVDNLEFTVRTGEIFGFLGPNGAGKSTTLNIISTLLDYDKGDIRIAGHDLRREARAIKSLIGLVPQEIALFPTLTAQENVSYFAGLYGLGGSQRKQAVAEALEFVGLAEQAKKRAGKMSGGQQRRLNIACGISHDPQLIILDEPTVGVDAQSREHIMDSIRTLRDRGATIIYTSHYMPEVQEICDRIAIIDHGKLVGIGTEAELLAVVTDVKSIVVELEPQAGLAIEGITDKLGLLPDVRRVIADADGSQLRIDVDLAFSDITPLVKVLMEAGVRVRSFNNEAPDLESTFLALTGRELRQG
ncbi:MAG: ABC transporter ATP-binding protein [Coriobacteriales bacterium]|jgi:ABC-2 type transport system ATP-binding protein|nr:ABC transporter ATP-binding protein [Coriobacteriales bacterium]